MSFTGGQVSLIGKWFHSFTSEGKVRWQGQIIGFVKDEYYIVQLYEWVLGSPSDKIVVSLTKMVDEQWAMYEDEHEMNDRYESYHSHRLDRSE